MKKTVSVLLALILMFSLGGCVNNDEKSSEQHQSDSSLTSTTSSEENSPANNGKVESEEEISSSPETLTSLNERFDKTVTIDETVLVDEDFFKITAKRLIFDDNAVRLELELVNKRNEVTSVASGVSPFGYTNYVNGYGMGSSAELYCEIPPWESQVASIDFDYALLAMYGIYTIADIEIGFLFHGRVVYPKTVPILTSAHRSYDYSKDTYKEAIQSASNALTDYSLIAYADDKLYDNNGISVVSEALVTYDDYTLLLVEVENGTTDFIEVSADNLLLINSVQVESDWSWSCYVCKWKRSLLIIDISNFDESLKPNEISSVGFNLSVYKSDIQLNGNNNILIDSTDVNVSFDNGVS